MRFFHRFCAIWTIVFFLVLWSQLRSNTEGTSVQEINTAAAHILTQLGYVFVLLAVFYYTSRVVRRFIGGSQRRGFFAELSSRPLAPRVTRCYNCKRTITAHTGSNCHFCHWIRCRCGACGCGSGRLA